MQNFSASVDALDMSQQVSKAKGLIESAKQRIVVKVEDSLESRSAWRDERTPTPALDGKVEDYLPNLARGPECGTGRLLACHLREVSARAIYNNIYI